MGVSVREVTGEVKRVPVTEAQFRASVDSEIAAGVKKGLRGETGEFVQMLRTDGGRAGHLEFRPIFGRLIISPEGRFLAERVDLDPHPLANGDSATWDVFGNDGKIQGRLVTGPRLRPRAFEGDYLFAVLLDENDVPCVVKYRLETMAANR
jgi:hypothetical protein